MLVMRETLAAVDALLERKWMDPIAATHLLLREISSHPRFILSCVVGDFDSVATNTSYS
jgi:hypothetical protein